MPNLPIAKFDVENASQQVLIQETAICQAEQVSLINERDFPEGKISLLKIVSTSKSTSKSSKTECEDFDKSNTTSTMHFLEASRTADKSALAPKTRDRASITIDFPEPVSPVTTLVEGQNQIGCRHESKLTIEMDCNNESKLMKIKYNFFKIFDY